MSRRLSERALPDFSQLIDGNPQLSLTPDNQQGRGREVRFHITGTWPQLFIGRAWLRALAQCGHLAHRAGTAVAPSSRKPNDLSGEGGATC